jgi:hypothetical protein
MRAWLIVASVACSSPASPGAPRVAPVTPGTPIAAPVPAVPATPTVERYLVVGHGGHKSGHFTKTTKPGGEIAVVFHVLQNGRGPHVEATMRLAPDLTITEFSATGHHEMGTKVAETFRRTGDRVAWKSEEEQGDRAITGGAFFVPIADLPITGLLAAAAVKAGGTIALLPGGQARIEPAGELEVTVGANKRKLVGHAIRGLDFVARYTWFDTTGAWFGQFSPWQSIVPEGWEGAIKQVIDHQLGLERVADQKLAAATRHVPPPAGIAFTHATVLDVEKGTWIADQTVLVIGDTIKAVGRAVAIPKGAEVVDLAGKRLMPGLIDMHSHTSPSDGVLDIAFGVTTIRDVGNDPDQLDELVQRFDAGTAVGPSLVRMGFIEGRNPKAAMSKVTAETVDEAKAAVEFYATRKYEGIKIYNSMKVELVPVLAKAAHARGMLVIGHVPVHMVANEAVRAGYDGIEHINQIMLNFFATKETDTRDTTRFTLVGERMGDFDLDGKPMRELIELFRQRKTILDPTMAAFEDLYAGIPGKITPGLEATVERLPVQVQRMFLTGGLPLDGNKRELYARAWVKLLAAVKTM